MVYAIPFAGAQELVILKVVNLNRLWPTRLQNVTVFHVFPNHRPTSEPKLGLRRATRR